MRKLYNAFNPRSGLSIDRQSNVLVRSPEGTDMLPQDVYYDNYDEGEYDGWLLFFFALFFSDFLFWNTFTVCLQIREYCIGG